MHCGTLVFKLMCLQQKASHQTSRHRACRFVVKIRCATRRGEHTPKYATVLGQFCYTVQQHAVYNNQNAECSHFSKPPCAHPFTQQAALAPYQNATPHPRTYCHALRNIHIYAPSKELRTTMRRDITQRNTCCYSLRCGRTTYERLNLTAVEAHAVNVQCYSVFTMALTQRTCTAWNQCWVDGKFRGIDSTRYRRWQVRAAATDETDKKPVVKECRREQVRGASIWKKNYLIS